MLRLKSISGIFIRFFAGIWLTLLFVGALVWGASSFFTEAPSNYGSFEHSPAAERAIGTALGIARWGGEDALITWLKDPEVNTRPEVFVVDPSGHEISGRSIPQKRPKVWHIPVPRKAFIRCGDTADTCGLSKATVSLPYAPIFRRAPFDSSCGKCLGGAGL